MASATVTVCRLAVFALDTIAKNFAIVAEPRAVVQHVGDLTMELLPDYIGSFFHVLDAWRDWRPGTWNGSDDSVIAQ